MSHYKPYPAYKESGVEWIGLVPEHWEVKPIKIVASCNDDSLSEAISPDTPIRYVDISAVSHDKGITDAEPMLFGDAPSRARRTAKVGDVVVSTVRTYLKAVASVDEGNADCVYSTGFAVLRARIGQLKPEFLKWLALNELIIQAIEAHSEGLSYPAINAPDLTNLKAVLPGLGEQVRISTILDRETTRIDSLITKKTRFIELLKEKSQALITHAVTKGLDPKAKMKDSGVEWIGEVPEHWAAMKFGRIASVAEGLVDPLIEPYRSMTLIAPNHIESGTGKILKLETSAEQNAESGKYTCPAGAVVYSKIRPALAKVSIAPFDALCSADMYPLQCTNLAENKWLFYLMLSRPFTLWAILESDRVAMPKINRESLSDLSLYVPPRVEQAGAVQYLDLNLPKIDAIAFKVKRSIDLLRERRSAFITAAVTGQIDLREPT
ncbi:restriction endonuclease subunit S [Rhodoferax antarcticus]|uniref:Putative type I restriction-modification system, S subunit n=1 Tax=Rhodoferax antarcticus ANT.BR TaxID=1111071 RepID=A0A1Q8Y9C1_9BURK|nr:restriction endonuclease subunit S [Rhodoferax antarcticus]OLP04594.1 putative type I restriction-modification system, S subunit [Rhodoferax antarcticus ANT.BR]